MKHTPGPWHCCDRDGAHVYIRADQTDDYGHVPNQLLAKVWLQGPEFSDANARLIAAAPDLLESAKILIGEIYSNSAYQHLMDTVEVAALLNAIIKAEGEK